MGLSFAFTHRDDQFYDDLNKCLIPEKDVIDFNMTYKPNEGKWSYLLYCKSITDEVNFLNDIQLPGSVGSTMSPLGKGRVIQKKKSLRLVMKILIDVYTNIVI